jgi:hypothetical protein
MDATLAGATLGGAVLVNNAIDDALPFAVGYS